MGCIIKHSYKEEGLKTKLSKRQKGWHATVGLLRHLPAQSDQHSAAWR